MEMPPLAPLLVGVPFCPFAVPFIAIPPLPPLPLFESPRLLKLKLPPVPAFEKLLLVVIPFFPFWLFVAALARWCIESQDRRGYDS